MDNKNYFDKKPSANFNSMYEANTDLVLTIDTLFRKGAEIVYDTYEHFGEYKKNEGLYNKLEKYIKDANSIYERTNSPFLTFYNMYKSVFTADADFWFYLLGNEFLDSIKEIKNEIYNKNTLFVCYDIDSMIEMHRDHYGPIRSSFGVKIKPYFSQTLPMLQHETNSIPEVTYKIVFDMDRILNMIMSEMGKYLDNRPVEQASDKESFLIETMKFFTPKLENYAQCIMLEWMSTENNIRSDKDAFYRAYGAMYKKVLETSSFVRCHKAVVHLIRKGSGDLNYNYKSKMLQNSLFDSVENRVENGSEIDFESNYFKADGDMLSALSRGIWNGNKGIFKNMGEAVFQKALTHFYERSVTFDFFMYKTYNRDDSIIYDRDMLLSVANGIDNYVTKDFFKSIIANTIEMTLIGEDTIRNLANGKSSANIFVKNKKLSWLYMAAEMQMANNLFPQINELYNNRETAGNDIKILNEACRNFYNSSSNLMNDLLDAFNEQGVKLDRRCRGNSISTVYLSQLIESMSSYINEYPLELIRFYNSSFDELKKLYIKNHSSCCKIKKLYSYNEDEYEQYKTQTHDKFKDMLSYLDPLY